MGTLVVAKIERQRKKLGLNARYQTRSSANALCRLDVGRGISTVSKALAAREVSRVLADEGRRIRQNARQV